MRTTPRLVELLKMVESEKDKGRLLRLLGSVPERQFEGPDVTKRLRKRPKIYQNPYPELRGRM